MTVLVDEARWPLRGALWAHLVSDESYDELHELAATIGKRRLGFQGDHYDVDTIDRDRAIDAGAVPIGARELVRRLVSAGLRRSDAKPRWRPVGLSPPGAPLDAVLNGLERTGEDAASRLGRALGLMGPVAVTGRIGAWSEPDRLVVLIDLPPGVDGPEPGPWRDLVDLTVVGGPRVDGERSIELFNSRPTSTGDQ